MEGRRINRQSKKYNPLFILFLCLVAAALVLLILSIVLGIRLSSSSKKLQAANKQVTELKQEISQLQDDLAVARERTAPSGDSSASRETASPATNNEAVTASSWLDLSGHSEFKVAPTNLLDSYATYYTTAGVNLRAGPATSYDRITTLDYGDKVQVAARDGNWSFVNTGKYFGWVSSDYLSTSEPTPQLQQKTTASSTPAVKRAEATSGSLRT